jgi:hypothetical protein
MGRKKNKTQSENYQELRDEFKNFKEFIITHMSDYATEFYVACEVECLKDQVETIKIHNRYYLTVIAVVLPALLLSNMISCMSGCPSCHRNTEPPVPQNRVSKIQDRVPEYIDGTILNIDEINDNSCFRIRKDKSKGD